ncbi:MAG: PspC domain-containing protein [Desulfobacterales bacterium]|nr:MAG: PspC domain-containing protein [Desulfobacterales bacterium]
MSRNSSIHKRGLYRSRNGVILGVCRGFADYFDFSVFWARAIAVILLIFTHFWPAIGLYLLAALLMKSQPATHVRTGSKNGFDSRYTYAKHDMAERLKRKWQHLEKRIRRMEAKVTSREFDWNNRFPEK